MSDNRGPGGVHGEGGTLDVAIDRAVRRMMAAEPPPGLRQRVLARLRQRETPSWRFGLLPQFALAGAAAVVIILGVSMMMMRPGVTVAPPPPQSAAVAPSSPAPAPPEPPSARPAPVEREAAPQTATAAGPRQERLPEPPQMTDVFGARDPRVAATSVPSAAAGDPATPELKPGTPFRSPLAGLPPTRIEDLKLPLVRPTIPGRTP